MNLTMRISAVDLFENKDNEEGADPLAPATAPVCMHGPPQCVPTATTMSEQQLENRIDRGLLICSVTGRIAGIDRASSVVVLLRYYTPTRRSPHRMLPSARD